MADSSWSSWFASPDDHDDAFDARIAAVRGLIEGATEERPEAMRKQLETLKAKTKVERADLMELQDIEAEAALYADKNALYAIYLRMKDRCFRLNKSVRAAWVSELDRLFPDSTSIANEDLARRQLTLVGREINSETAEYVRKTAEKARVLGRLSAWCIALIGIFLSLCITFVLSADPDNYLQMAPAVAVAGGIGASISALRGMRNEKLRDESIALLRVQYFIRSFLGLFYASLVFAGVTTGLFPLKIPTEKLAFLLALGFVSGFSDALFAQTVSRFTQPSEQSDNP